MDLPVTEIATVLGTGVVSAILVVGALWVAKTAVLAAVKQSGQREIENLRNAAAADLERFKAELTGAAETRRQVAARRVEALVDLGLMSERLLLGSANALVGSGSFFEEGDKYRDKLRETAILFPKPVADELLGFLGAITSAHLAASERGAIAYPEVLKAVEKVQALVRRELGTG